MGIFNPVYSHKRPSASVSEIPNAHLLMVLKVAGNTTMASARGKTSGSSGRLYWLRTGWPVSCVSRGISMNSVPCGVVMTHTFHPAACACTTKYGTSVAEDAAQLILYKTPLGLGKVSPIQSLDTSRNKQCHLPIQVFDSLCVFPCLQSFPESEKTL